MLSIFCKKTRGELTKALQYSWKSSALFSTESDKKFPPQDAKFKGKKKPFKPRRDDKTQQSGESDQAQDFSTAHALKGLQSELNFELEDPHVFDPPKEAKSQTLNVENVEPKTGSHYRYKQLKSELNKKKSLKANLEKLQSSHLEPYHFTAIHKDGHDYNPIKAYNKKTLDEIAENSKKSAEALKEYYEGEEGVDKVDLPNNPLDEFLEYESDVFFDIKNGLLGLGAGLSNSWPEYLNWKKEIEDVKNLEDLTSEPLKPYPGSSKGPRPSDDPEYFAQWSFANIPKKLLDIYRRLDPEELGVDPTTVQSDRIEITASNVIDSDMRNWEIPFNRPEMSLIESGATIDMHSKLQEGELPPAPASFDLPWGNALETFERWSSFGNVPKMISLVKILERFTQNLTEEQIIDKPKLAPTLYAYYNLLPDFVRENPAVKNIYRKLETTKYSISQESKQLMLNYAAQFTLPMEKEMKEAFALLITTQIGRTTAAQDLSILAMDSDEELPTIETPDGKKVEFPVAEFAGMDATQVYDRIKVLDGVDHGLGNWIYPEPMNPHVPEEEPSKIPVDYYDNEDGFWNGYIAWKEKQYNHYPLIKSRPHFKH